MKKIFCLLLIVLQLLCISPILAIAIEVRHSNHTGFQQYLNWVDDARNAVTEQFPGATMVDFLYVGFRATSSVTSGYIFKFWMTEGTRQFAVYVTLSTNQETNELTNSSVEETEVAIPSFGKWRQLAVESVQKNYPHATIVDYHPYGCLWISPNKANQSFSFWLTQNHKPLFILTTLTYKTATEEVTSVDFKTLPKSTP